MAGHGSPYIKSEPNDFFDNNYMTYPGQSNSHQIQYNGNMNIQPSGLSNSMSQSQTNMASSFNMGNAGIADDELMDLNFGAGGPQDNFDMNQGMGNFFHNGMNQQQQMNMYSSTPDGGPIQSPFTGEFNYNQFRPVGQQQQQQQQQFGGHSLPQQGGLRPHAAAIDRKLSDPRSPTTPGMQSLQIGSDEFHSNNQPIRHQRQAASMGNGWESTPSGHSWNESPFASPNTGAGIHPQIEGVMKNTSHHSKVASSLPTKIEGGGMPGMQSQEAKRRRRRESHNMVERRRRDNINERIQDLGALVPQHRLEDEKVRKHLQTNAPLSPSIAASTGMSPPNAATSLLAGPQGRRATSGGITQGLPLEDKDKGPNKGDILNGSVAWTRDLMWMMQERMTREQKLKQMLESLGQEWPFPQSEEERRMDSELMEIINKHGGFTEYSRSHGSGLRVPGFTNIAGDPTNGDGNGYSNHPTTSPGFQSGGSGASSGRMSHMQTHNFGGDIDYDFKEEDNFSSMIG